MRQGPLELRWNPAAFDFEHPRGAAFLTNESGVIEAEHWETKATRACLQTIELFGDSTSAVALDNSRMASEEELLLCHSTELLADTQMLPTSKVRAARLSAGMALDAVAEVLSGRSNPMYLLTRPAGHHAERDRFLGGCVFNNAALVAAYALNRGTKRVAILDWDVHHGNGAQQIFWDDPRVLTTSIHQAVPASADRSGCMATGGAEAPWSNLNIPLPPGSGWHAYTGAIGLFEQACESFKPQLVIVASGIDSSTLDPAGRMMLHSRAYGDMSARVAAIASRHANDRLLITHEGGYAVEYVPYCIAAILAGAQGSAKLPSDPFYDRWAPFSGDQLEPHQAAAIDEVSRAFRMRLD